MTIGQITTTSRHRAAIPGGPTVASLTPVGSSDQVAVVRVEIPAGGGMPEHDHGVSEIVLIPLSGTAELRNDGKAQTLSAGMAAYIACGERVSLANPGSEPAFLMVVASPPEFARRLAAWPAA